MTVVRMIELIDSSGNLILNSEVAFYFPIKKAILYWSAKTKHLSDEDFISWIKEQNKKGTLIYADDCNGLKEVLSLSDFSLITDEQSLIFCAYASMMDYLTDANKLNLKF